MDCNCGSKTRTIANSVRLYAIVDNLALANTPNLIPDSDKFLTFNEAKAALGDSGKFVVSILGGGLNL